MRVLLLNSEYPPLGGGAGNFTYHLLHILRYQPDLEIDVVTAASHSSHVETLGPQIHLEFLDIGKRGKNIHSQSYLDLLRFAIQSERACRSFMRSKRYDLVHAINGLPCGYTALRLKLPYILSLRGTEVPGHSPAHAPIYTLLRPVIIQTWKRAGAVVTNSQDLTRLAQKTCPELPFVLIPNGVDTAYFVPGPKRQENELRILYVGRMNPIKNLPTLLTAFQQFSTRFPHATLTLVGEGPQLPELQARFQDRRIKFVGRKNRGELLTYYQQSDVFVLPSITEGMSNALLEAAACGLAIAATDTGGVRELFNADVDLFPVGNANALAAIFDQYVRQPEFLTKRKTAARQRVQDLSWDKVAQAYSSLYRRVAQTDAR